MITFLDIISFAIVLANTFFVYQILKTFLPIRGPLIVRLLAFLPCHYMTDIIIYSHDTFNILGVLVGFMAYMVILFKGGIIQKLSIVFILYPLLVAGNFLFQDIGRQVFQLLPMQTELYSTITHTASLILRTILWFAVWRLTLRRLKNIMDLLDTKMWVLLDSICAAVLAGLLVVLNYLPEAPQIGCPVAIASIVTVFGCLYLISYIANSVQTKYQLKELQMEYQYYEDKLKEEERIRSIYHDMKNHLLLLQEPEGDSQESGQMIAALQEQISSYENYYKTGNTFLDIIIRDKAQKAKEQGIDFSAMVHFEDGGFLEPLDISAIFGNALDNAIEASLKLPSSERLITIKANRFRDMLSIVIENNAAPEIAADQQTTKQDKFQHGFGLKSIEKSAEKYQGQCSVKQEAGSFILEIIIPIP